MKAKVNVIVTATGGGGFGAQIIKSLRLGQLDYHIIGTDITAQSVGRSMADEFHVLPTADAPDYLDSLLDLAATQKAVALFHGCEREMVFFSRNAEQIRSNGLYLPVNSMSLIDLCHDKTATCEFLSRQGLPVPKFCRADNANDLETVDFFPAVLKPSMASGGSSNVFIAQSMEELLNIGRYVFAFCDHMIVQEYVGTPENEFTVGLLYAQDGTFINSIAVRRMLGNALSVRLKVPNNSNRPDLGPMLVISSGISQGEIGRFREITAQCEEIGAALKPTAPINIQCRVVAGKVVPMEINPRLSGTTSLRALNGFNEPDLLIRRDVFGEDVPVRFPYGESLILRHLQEVAI
jgi:carbamoyl-phosphate synthase large subunit